MENNGINARVPGRGGRADACGHVRAPDRAYQRSDVSFLLEP